MLLLFSDNGASVVLLFSDKALVVDDRLTEGVTWASTGGCDEEL